MLGDSEGIITGKQDLHEALDRNGFMVPPFKCKVNTQDYLLKVKAGTNWVPMYSSVRIASCYRKPTKEAAMNELQEVLYKHNYDIGFTDATLVDIDWILRVMSTLAPTHQYFNKGWSP